MPSCRGWGRVVIPGRSENPAGLRVLLPPSGLGVGPASAWSQVRVPLGLPRRLSCQPSLATAPQVEPFPFYVREN